MDSTAGAVDCGTSQNERGGLVREPFFVLYSGLTFFVIWRRTGVFIDVRLCTVDTCRGDIENARGGDVPNEGSDRRFVRLRDWRYGLDQDRGLGEVVRSQRLDLNSRGNELRITGWIANRRQY